MVENKLNKKLLMIRFSSFGDVLQCLSIPSVIKIRKPNMEIHWVIKEEYAELLKNHPNINKVWILPKKRSLQELFKLAWILKKEKFSFIYDAHNNLRSGILSLLLVGPFNILGFFKKIKFLRKSQFRFKRFLLFKFSINLYPKPFIGQMALIEPLKKWGVKVSLPPTPQFFLTEDEFKDGEKIIFKKFSKNSKYNNKNCLFIIALAPSASYPLKRWPKEYWEYLIANTNPEWCFILLGGEKDLFLSDIAKVNQDRVLNLAGNLTYRQNAFIIANCDLLISNDTGIMHIAEQLGKKCIAFLGPAPFGYPGRKTTRVKEIELPCRPCSKHGQGPCVNKERHKCLRDISPQEIIKDCQEYFWQAGNKD